MRRAFCLVFATAATFIASPPHTAGASTPLPALTIRLTDLRPGYITVESRTRTQSTVAAQEPMVAQLLQTHGWLGGYEARYQRRDNTRIQVGEVADRFRTVPGAHWWYEATLLRVPSDYRSTTMTRVGDESTAVESRAYIGIIFRQGVDVMDVYVSMQAPSPSLAVLAIARLVDRRLAVDQAAPSVRSVTRALPLHAWVHSRAIQYRADVVLYARTMPGARCSASIAGAAPRSRVAYHGYTLGVGTSGLVSWRWLLRSPSVRGTAHVTCAYGKQVRTGSAAFAVR